MGALSSAVRRARPSDGDRRRHIPPLNPLRIPALPAFRTLGRYRMKMVVWRGRFNSRLSEGGGDAGAKERLFVRVERKSWLARLGSAHFLRGSNIVANVLPTQLPH